MNAKVVDTPFACVRKERKKNSSIVVLVQENADIDVDPIFVDPDWYKVETATHCHGWVSRQYIALKE